MFILDFDYIDLDKIYESGQVFRWVKVDDKEYEIPIYNKYGDVCYHVKQPDLCTIKCEKPKIVSNDIYLKDYFDIKTNYEDIHNRLIENKAPQYLVYAAGFSRGIRILRQPIWETIVSFIISQNNNIPRIKKSIKMLCDSYGSFPSSWDIITKPQLLNNCGLGYRNPYILDAALKWIQVEKLLSMRTTKVKYLPYNESKKYFMEWNGIGPKVADCICLYGLHFLEAFPRDTWIKKIEDKHFNGRFPDELYPDCAGVLQQYMFYYERMKNK